ncbi:MAG: hypothetical protein KGJ66_08285 [Alphaproteobacteria bacterium]|nr:hypothetical protein [Alphaproteobacteria bacterium]
MDAHESPPKPIACTLSAGVYQERLAWIAELNQAALQNVRRESARLILAYDPRAAVRVREMIRREQECCAFLQFDLNESEKELTLAITAPHAARDTLDTLFDPFLTGASARGSCACATVAR